MRVRVQELPRAAELFGSPLADSLPARAEPDVGRLAGVRGDQTQPLLGDTLNIWRRSRLREARAKLEILIAQLRLLVAVAFELHILT